MPAQRLRDDRDFRRFWTARTLSVGGAVFTYVALPVIVYDLTGSPLVTSLVATFEALPYLLFGLVAGALADRLDRKRVMVVADVANAAILGSIPVAAWLDALTVLHVLVAAFLSQAVFVFFDTANLGALPVLVGRDRIVAANSAIWGTASLLDVVMPAAAGALLAVVTAPTVVSIDALTFLASALLIRSISRAMSGRDASATNTGLAALRGEVADGLRWLVAHAGVRTMTIIGACQSFAGGAFMGQWVVWADQRLDVQQGDARLGVIFAGWGVGGVLASVAMPRLVRRFGTAKVVLLALPLSAALGVATALAGTLWVATVLLGAWGFAYMLVVVNSVTFRQQVTPEQLLSRVNATGRMLSFGVGWPLGAVVGGAVAEAYGPSAGILTGALVIVVGVVVAWTSPIRSGMEAQERPS
ncbi:MAG: MFS transporter [Candidatus Nanopelagicales bacterium]